MDVNYQAHDVALAGAATKANGHEQTNGFKLGDHHQMEIDDGIIIDPFGVGLSNRSKITSDMYGIRISARQSPVYQLISIYGPTLVVYPSQAIHTTWWQFEY